MTIKHIRNKPVKSVKKPIRNSKKDLLAGKHTEIVCILDRSGSMSAIQDDTIGGFNEFLTRQKKVEGEARLTLVLFDDQYEVVHSGVDLKAVAPLTKDTFVPRGSTALLDAIGRTLSTLADRIARASPPKRPDRVIIAILTDGEENASREYGRQSIFDMIAKLREKRGWEFVFLAANQDAMAAAASLSIDSRSTMGFRSDGEGTRKAFRGMSNMFTSRRRNRSKPIAAPR